MKAEVACRKDKFSAIKVLEEIFNFVTLNRLTHARASTRSKPRSITIRFLSRRHRRRAFRGTVYQASTLRALLAPPRDEKHSYSDVSRVLITIMITRYKQETRH